MKWECEVCCEEDHMGPCVIINPSKYVSKYVGTLKKCPWGLDDAAWVEVDSRLKEQSDER